jgi:HPt (histidine-containing phosphotransfer) domain-containing protein
MTAALKSLGCSRSEIRRKNLAWFLVLTDTMDHRAPQLSSANQSSRAEGRFSDAVAPLDELVARTGNNRSLIAELIEIFESESESMLAELHRSLDARDGKGVQAAAHRLRGSLRIFGARRALDVVVDLESMGREGVLDRASTRLQELEHETHSALAVLQSYRSLLAVPVLEH